MKFVVLLCVLASVLGEDLRYASFRSFPVELKSGQIANTQAYTNATSLDWVDGPIAIRHFNAVLVDEENNTVPMTEVYVHHWLVYDSGANSGLCPNLVNIFGIGAELYHTEYNYPAPHAVVTTGKERWTANLHFIRTTNVPDVQMCIECHCPDSVLPDHPHGGVECCPDRGQCWGMQNSTLEDTKKYYLAYTIGYVPVTPEVVALEIFSLDATATNSYDCQIQYDIPQLKEGETNTLTSRATIPSNMSVVFMETHQHIGGTSMNVDHYRNGELIGPVCHTIPEYGNGTEVGNEIGYLVKIPTCRFPDLYKIQAGDQLEFTSVYTARTLPGGHAWHEGVMALVFMAAVAEPNPALECVQDAYHMCGPPPYSTYDYCKDCVTQSWPHLEDVCTKAMLEHLCSKNLDNGNIPAPDVVASTMSFNIHAVSGTKQYTWNMTGPEGRWFAIGYNPLIPMMNDTVTFVYTEVNGKEVLQARLLGNHFAGSIITDDVPATITKEDGQVNIIFTPPASTIGYGDDHKSMCFLFAQGKDMALGYHAANRGNTCLKEGPN